MDGVWVIVLLLLGGALAEERNYSMLLVLATMLVVFGVVQVPFL